VHAKADVAVSARPVRRRRDRSNRAGCGGCASRRVLTRLFGSGESRRLARRQAAHGLCIAFGAEGDPAWTFGGEWYAPPPASAFSPADPRQRPARPTPSRLACWQRTLPPRRGR
jgi:hypothetical protein